MTTPSRLSFDDALTLWQARDVYRVQAVLRGLVYLLWSMTLLVFFTMGHGLIGMMLVAFQWAMLRGLRVVLTWAARAMWTHSTTPRRDTPYAHPRR